MRTYIVVTLPLPGGKGAEYRIASRDDNDEEHEYQVYKEIPPLKSRATAFHILDALMEHEKIQFTKN